MALMIAFGAEKEFYLWSCIGLRGQKVSWCSVCGSHIYGSLLLWASPGPLEVHWFGKPALTRGGWGWGLPYEAWVTTQRDGWEYEDPHVSGPNPFPLYSTWQKPGGPPPAQLSEHVTLCPGPWTLDHCSCAQPICYSASIIKLWPIFTPNSVVFTPFFPTLQSRYTNNQFHGQFIMWLHIICILVVHQSPLAGNSLILLSEYIAVGNLVVLTICLQQYHQWKCEKLLNLPVRFQTDMWS